ncbi:hypothetical protein [Actinoplanes sp. N902-109]|uniref:hypothetical protein n=1 Tax=Actinoplanes sp. (strain N902-109) TaxID=649831 RepID=UPI0003295FDF|nr:hypothetical protein [Actinoplanes sp. N902-109]AGL18924.1 hypothetical protein L083_5414 [Actinoplanes sp. N902-109]
MPDPSFHAIVVVDLEGFGRRTNLVQRALRAAMYEVVRAAFADAGIDATAVVSEDRGDGIIMLVPGTPTLALAGKFVRALDAALREKAALHSESHRMRMRVALHQGLCEPDAEGWIGEPINTAARLVDAAPLKQTLATAQRAVMALIVSGDIYRSVIRHDYRLVDSAEFARVRVDAKELTGEEAWIRVPGYANPPGLADPDRPEHPEPGPAPAAVPTHQTVNGISFTGSSVHVAGDMIAGNKYAGGGR